MIKKFKKFFSIILIMASLLIAFNFFTLPQKQVYADIENFEKYSEDVTNILRQYDSESEREINFVVGQDVFTSNNELMIDGKTFSEFTGAKILYNGEKAEIEGVSNSVEIFNNEEYIKIDEEDVEISKQKSVVENGECQFDIKKVASALGYEVSVNKNILTLTRRFATKRLIVRSEFELDSKGAVAVAEGYNNLHVFQYETEKQAIDAFNYYKNLEEVEFVDADAVFEADQTENINNISKNANTKGLLNSFSYASWGASKIGVEDYSRFLLNNQSTLPEVVVAVLDTGIDSDHPWFSNRIKEGGKNYSSSPNGTPAVYEDVRSHGTHVSGTIVDLTLSNVKILPIKVLNNEGKGSTTSITNAITYVTNLKKQGMNICAINMSLGGAHKVGSGGYTLYKDAITEAFNNGIISVVAAGNESDNVANHCPANIDIALTVGAVEETSSGYVHSSYSNYGEFVDVSAPGTDINSAYIDGTTTYNSGTSMATPHVSGLVALLNSYQTYSPAHTEQILDLTCHDIGSRGWDGYYGEGVVNIQHAYAQLQKDSIAFSRTESTFSSSFDLTISSTLANSKIYYTLDGSIPSIKSNLYQSPITINKTKVVRAVAYVVESGVIKTSSEIETQIYVCNNQDIDNAYEINSNGTITKYSGVLETLTVPSTINGIRVKRIGNGAFSSTSVKNVTLANSIIEIDDYAFDLCFTIETITAPGVESVGLMSFNNAINLSEINLPKAQTISDYAFFTSDGNENVVELNLPSVQKIGACAFYNFTNLTNVYLPMVEYIGYASFANSTIQTLNLPNAKNIAGGAFENNVDLEQVSAPKLEVVGAFAFASASNLSQFISNDVKFVGNYAFYECELIQTFDFSDLISVGNFAFYGCSLNEFVAPNVEFVGMSALMTNNLSSVELNRVVEIESYAFADNVDIENVELSPFVEKIANSSFIGVDSNCKFKIHEDTIAKSFVINNGYSYENISTTSVFRYSVENGQVSILGSQGIIPETLTIPSYIDSFPVVKVGERAFENCSQIKTLFLPTLKIIEGYAFNNCVNLQSVKLSNVEIISENAFSSCSNLESVEIENVKTLGNFAFYNCSSLLSIKLNNEIENIGEKAFGYINNSVNPSFEIYGYENSVADEFATNNGITINYVLSDVGTFYYSTFYNNGVKEAAISKVYSTLVGEINVPKMAKTYNITKINENAFQNCCFITSIILPSSIKTIEKNAFQNCEMLEKINLENVSVINEYAFSNCYSLKEVNIPYIEEVSEFAFENCTSLKSVNASNLTTIKESAFSGATKLKSVNAPNLEHVEDFAFESCLNLTDISTQNLKYIGTFFSGELFDANSFVGCENLKKIYLPNIIEMGGDCFDSNLEIVVIGKNFEDYFVSSFDVTTTIYGYSGSLAETYATLKGNSFVPIEELSISIHEGTSVEFDMLTEANLTAVATGFDVKYQWFQTQTTISSGVAIEGATSNVLNLDTTVVGTKKYFVKATNWDGEEKTSSIIDVKIVDTNLPVFTIQAKVKSGQGKIFSSDETGFVNKTFEIKQGKTLSLIFSADNGYYLKNVYVDGVALNQVELENVLSNGYSFENVDDNHVLEVEFGIYVYTIQFSSNAYGEIELKGSHEFEYGENVTFKLIPYENCKLSYLLINGVKIYDYQIDLSVGYTINSIKSNMTVYAEFELNTYTINIVENSNGTIMPSAYSIKHGSSVNLTIVPNNGYELKDITINGESYFKFVENGRLEIIVTSEIEIITIFKKLQFNIEAIQTLNGTISPSGISTVEFGDEITYQFTPYEGYHLKEVIIDGEVMSVADIENVQTNGYTIKNIQNHHSITAGFEINEYSISIVTIGSGHVVPSESSVLFGQSVEFKIEANEGYQLYKITINNEEQVLSTKFTINNINKDLKVVVEFKKKSYKIMASAGVGGTISPSGIVEVLYKENQSFRFTPNQGYKIKDIKVNGESVGKENNFEMTSVRANNAIHVEFEKIKFNVTIICGTNGSVIPNGTTEVEFGDSKLIDITPNAGYAVSYISINNISVKTTQKLLLSNITENKEVLIEFTKQFNITTSSNNNGTISESSSVLLGREKQIIITPNQGYIIKDVKIDNVSVGAVSTYTFENVVESHSVEVEFVKAYYEIKINILGSGTIDCDNSLDEVAYNDNRTLTINADKNWKISTVKVNGELTNIENNTLVLNNVEKDFTIDVEFVEEEPVKDSNNATIIIIVSVVLGIVVVVVLVIVIKMKNKSKPRKVNTKNKSTEINNSVSRVDERKPMENNINHLNNNRPSMVDKDIKTIDKTNTNQSKPNMTKAMILQARLNELKLKAQQNQQARTMQKPNNQNNKSSDNKNNDN